MEVLEDDKNGLDVYKKLHFFKHDHNYNICFKYYLCITFQINLNICVNNFIITYVMI